MIGTKPTVKRPDTGSAIARGHANGRYKTKPIETYGDDRRCFCGTLLSKYNPTNSCATCRERGLRDRLG